MDYQESEETLKAEEEEERLRIEESLKEIERNNPETDEANYSPYSGERHIKTAKRFTESRTNSDSDNPSEDGVLGEANRVDDSGDAYMTDPSFSDKNKLGQRLAVLAKVMWAARGSFKLVQNRSEWIFLLAKEGGYEEMIKVLDSEEDNGMSDSGRISQEWLRQQSINAAFHADTSTPQKMRKRDDDDRATAVYDKYDYKKREEEPERYW